jgi:hypothetical protein
MTITHRLTLLTLKPLLLFQRLLVLLALKAFFFELLVELLLFQLALDAFAGLLLLQVLLFLLALYPFLLLLIALFFWSCAHCVFLFFKISRFGTALIVHPGAGKSLDRWVSILVLILLLVIRAYPSAHFRAVCAAARKYPGNLFSPGLLVRNAGVF